MSEIILTCKILIVAKIERKKRRVGCKMKVEKIKPKNPKAEFSLRFLNEIVFSCTGHFQFPCYTCEEYEKNNVNYFKFMYLDFMTKGCLIPPVIQTYTFQALENPWITMKQAFYQVSKGP